jgi:hypothetical protein
MSSGERLQSVAALRLQYREHTLRQRNLRCKSVIYCTVIVLDSRW